MYDVDGNGVIDIQEMTKIVQVRMIIFFQFKCHIFVVLVLLSNFISIQHETGEKPKNDKNRFNFLLFCFRLTVFVDVLSVTFVAVDFFIYFWLYFACVVHFFRRFFFVLILVLILVVSVIVFTATIRERLML